MDFGSFQLWIKLFSKDMAFRSLYMNDTVNGSVVRTGLTLMSVLFGSAGAGVTGPYLFLM